MAFSLAQVADARMVGGALHILFKGAAETKEDRVYGFNFHPDAVIHDPFEAEDFLRRWRQYKGLE